MADTIEQYMQEDSFGQQKENDYINVQEYLSP